MAKLGFKSPNKADALSMLFLRPDSTNLTPIYGTDLDRAQETFDANSTME